MGYYDVVTVHANSIEPANNRYSSQQNSSYYALVIIYNIAVCEPSCANEGVCIDVDTCWCPPGWSGHTCGDRKLIINVKFMLHAIIK